MTLNELKHETNGMNPVEFEKFLEDNNISNEWLDVCITNVNKGEYNVYLNDFNLCAYAHDGSEITIG